MRAIGGKTSSDDKAGKKQPAQETRCRDGEWWNALGTRAGWGIPSLEAVPHGPGEAGGRATFMTVRS